MTQTRNFTPNQVVQMLVWYSHPSNGNGPEQWVDAAYGHDLHPSYRAEKVKKANDGFLDFYAGLDSDNRQRLLDAMFERYGNDVTRRP